MGARTQSPPIGSTTEHRRRIFHAANALTTIGLIFTGFLITYPDLRAQLIGGYALQLAEWHRLMALAFMAMPVAWVLKTPTELLQTVSWHLRSTWLDLWRKAHYGICLVASAILVVTGTVLWLDIEVSHTTLDATVGAHVVSTWVVFLTIPLHWLSVASRVVRAKRKQDTERSHKAV